MRDDELSPTLRRAYEAEPETAEASDALWARTRGALRQRGLLSRRRGSGPRWSAAAWMAAASFAGGIVVGVLLDGGSPPVPAPPATGEAVAPAVAAERAQAAGTDYALAIESLVASLDQASAGEVETGREVVRSALEAHAATARPLWSEAPGPGGADEEGLIWF